MLPLWHQKLLSARCSVLLTAPNLLTMTALLQTIVNFWSDAEHILQCQRVNLISELQTITTGTYVFNSATLNLMKIY